MSLPATSAVAVDIWTSLPEHVRGADADQLLPGAVAGLAAGVNQLGNPDLDTATATRTAVVTNSITNPAYRAGTSSTITSWSLLADVDQGLSTDGVVGLWSNTSDTTVGKGWQSGEIATVPGRVCTLQGAFSLRASISGYPLLLVGQLVFYDAAHVQISQVQLDPVAIAGGAPTVTPMLQTPAPALTAFVRAQWFPLVGGGYTGRTGDLLELRNTTVTCTGNVVPDRAFTGGTSDDDTYTYAWTGTTDASTSTQSAYSVANWTPAGANLIWSPGAARRGAAAAIVSGSSSTVSLAAFGPAAARIPVTAISLISLVAPDVLAIQAIRVQLRFVIYNAAGAILGQSSSQPVLDLAAGQAGAVQLLNEPIPLTYQAAGVTVVPVLAFYSRFGFAPLTQLGPLASLDGPVTATITTAGVPAGFTGFDGDSEGGTWTGTPGASTSTRLVQAAVVAGYPLLRFLDGPGALMQQAVDVRDAWLAGDLFDPITCDPAWLKFTAAMLSVRPRPGASTGDIRQAITGAVAGWSVGTRDAIAAAAGTVLTGTRMVVVQPSVTAWTIGLFVRSDEAPPDLSTLIAAVDAAQQRPAGYAFTVTTISIPWSQVDANLTTWTSSEPYRTWAELDSIGY